MKHLLYGTTALVAAGLMVGAASPARADDKPIQITIGGYFMFFGSFVEQSKGNVDGGTANAALPGTGNSTVAADRKFDERSLIQFEGKTTLDNGLIAGVRVQLKGNPGVQAATQSTTSVSTTEQQTSEHYAYLDTGTFGRYEFGSTPSVARKMYYGASTPAQPWFGFNSPAEFPANSLTILDPSILESLNGTGNHDEKLNAYTPRIAGFQLGVSYAPDQCNQGNMLGNGYQCHMLFGTDPNNMVGQNKNLWVGALNYVNKFGDVNLGTYVYFSHGTLEAQAVAVGGVNGQLTDRTQIGGGANVTWAGWNFGAGVRTDNSGEHGSQSLAVTSAASFAPARRNDYLAGVSYTMGPWSFGTSLSYLTREEKNAAGLSPTSGTGAGHGNSSKDTGFGQVASVNYVLGPGINLATSIEHYEQTQAVTATTNGAITGTGLNTQNGQHAWIFNVGSVLLF